jgi:hypothetical protein
VLVPVAPPFLCPGFYSGAYWELRIIAFLFRMSITIHVFHARCRSENTALYAGVFSAAHPRSLKLDAVIQVIRLQLIVEGGDRQFSIVRCGNNLA